MDTPARDIPVQSAPEPLGAQWFALPAWVPLPGLGMLANNTFVHAGREPLLVDTGMAMLGDDFIAALGSVADPSDLRWIWLSHADPDHTGNLTRLLELAPRAQVVTGHLGRAKLQLLGQDVSRVRAIGPGEVLEAGDLRLQAVRPPSYDAPETLGFHDGHDTFYAVDAFGALLPAVLPRLAGIDEDVLRDGIAAWAALDAPWLADVDAATRARRFGAVATLQPARLLTAHLPLGRDSGERVAAAAIAASARLVDNGSAERVLGPVLEARAA